MGDKRLRLDLLPDGFLIEERGYCEREQSHFWKERFLIMNSLIRTMGVEGFRPALNYWHFNDGSMVLPDGLIINSWHRDNQKSNKTILLNQSEAPSCWHPHFKHYQDDPDLVDRVHNDCIAFRVLGVHRDYAEHGSELGMEVIE